MALELKGNDDGIQKLTVYLQQTRRQAEMVQDAMNDEMRTLRIENERLHDAVLKTKEGRLTILMSIHAQFLIIYHLSVSSNVSHSFNFSVLLR